MVKRSRRDDLHNTKSQMKFFNAIAAAVVFGGSIIATATPASAQFYGGSYGYNNGSPNSYGDFGSYNRAPRSYGSPGSNSFYQNKIAPRPQSSSGCSSFSMSAYC